MVVVAVSTLGVVLADVMEILELAFEEDDDPPSPVEEKYFIVLNFLTPKILMQSP